MSQVEWPNKNDEVPHRKNAKFIQLVVMTGRTEGAPTPNEDDPEDMLCALDEDGHVWLYQANYWSPVPSNRDLSDTVWAVGRRKD